MMRLQNQYGRRPSGLARAAFRPDQGGGAAPPGGIARPRCSPGASSSLGSGRFAMLMPSAKNPAHRAIFPLGSGGSDALVQCVREPTNTPAREPQRLYLGACTAPLKVAVVTIVPRPLVRQQRPLRGLVKGRLVRLLRRSVFAPLSPPETFAFAILLVLSSSSYPPRPILRCHCLLRLRLQLVVASL
jgi:hypothetical protein